MPKPWGKTEIDFLDHPKFRALHVNAIVLWLEGKNYCDKFLTDGRFPKDIARTFRRYSVAAMAQLMRSCGVKPTGESYAPLWGLQEIGGVSYIVMHDYLDHNDCRDAALERMADVKERDDLRRLRDRQRKQEQRAKRREEIARLASAECPLPVRGQGVGQGVGQSADSPQCPRTVHPPTETATATETDLQRERRARAPTALDGALPRDHRNHVFCDPGFSICVAAQVHAKFLNALARRYGGDRQQTHEALVAWYAQTAAALPPDTVMGDGFKFWQPLFDAAFTTPAKPARDYEADVRAEAEAIAARLRREGAMS